MQDRQIVDDVRNAVDIGEIIGSYVPLKRVGAALKGLCPFHNEKTPSFQVRPDHQSWHCFGCGKGGDVFSFVMEKEGMDFPSALRMLARQAGIEVPEFQSRAKREGAPSGPGKDDLYAVNDATAKLYQQQLLSVRDSESEQARAYLKKRKLDGAIARTWGIGYAPAQWGFLSSRAGKEGWNRSVMEEAGLVSTNEKGELYDRFRERIMFSIRDERGRVVGFSGRILNPSEKSAKYVNSPETPIFQKSRILFGLDQAKPEMLKQRTALLCEGQIDCIRCHLAGFNTAVASQGTAFTEKHARLLKRFVDSVVIVLDADEAGKKAALKSAAILMEAGIAVTLAKLPEGMDPDSLILEKGPEEFQAVLNAAQGIIQFQLDMFKALPGGLQAPGVLARATSEILEMINHAPTAVERERLQQEAARGLGVGIATLKRDMRQAMNRRRPAAAPASQGAAEPRPERKRYPKEEEEFAILLVSSAHAEIRTLAQQYIRYDILSNAVCRAVIHALVDEVEPAQLMARMSEEDGECQTFAARILNAPQKMNTQDDEISFKSAGQDLLRRIWLKYLEARKERAFRRSLKPGDNRRALQEEWTALLKDVKALQHTWEQAKPVVLKHMEINT